MVKLFVLEPDWRKYGDSESAKQIISLLKKLESVIRSVVTSGGRSEARLWLHNTISGITSITPQQQCELFVNLLRSKSTRRALASQLMQMIFEKRPRKAGSVLAKKSYILEKFFEGNPRRILQWFSNFAYGAGSEHKRGAKALSQFAFMNRDICWEELEWKGKHGQSPAVVATKPHYFLDLDIQRTVDNFLENVPEFWSSDEFAESLKDGEILFLDTKFFGELFVDLMYKEDSQDVWEVIKEFLMEESFAYLSHHLLVILEEPDFSSFLEMVCKYINPVMDPKNFGYSSFWPEVTFSKFRDYESIEQLLLLNAVVNQGRQLLRLVNDEEYSNVRTKIEDIISEISTASSNTDNLASVLKECFKMKMTETIKLLGLLSWVMHYRLSKECLTPDSWKILFTINGISFKTTNKHALIDNDKSDESEPGLDHRKSSKTRRRKKHKSRKKRRRNIYNDDDDSDNELLDFDMTSGQQSLQLHSMSWLLSTDRFSASWTNVDLPEHLSRHCFVTWMKWVVARWTDAG
ncbi:uncharacterized protein LOC110821597 [Carica papaya]|uniref:uncharacterized protein LOC110821597 n=1 Tax=Carica papaya TaxID=3649 RepID=UPI000B8C821B|nr:uncharacterized protein LOC110821597 [Carica papaya]XP_021907188.1 uncharacterized protein LOC110821597 [Carica papaya]